MSNISKILLIFAAVLASVYLLVPQYFVFPVSGLVKTVPIWILAVIAWREAPKAYRLSLSLALVFSGVGDFALAANVQWTFAVGMAAFLIGHLFYLLVFSKTLRSWSELDLSRRTIIVLIGLYALVMGAIVLPKTGALMPAIAVYFIVLSLMAAASFAAKIPRWTRIGALLFVISDTLIGIDKFLTPIEFRHLSVMSEYYSAQ
ncbi:MAG: lysoplasmalogenase, partial [Robiginitomaculum sp.]|nr:lysoplasmalogenase [Robiginitomaculum sp.]